MGPGQSGQSFVKPFKGRVNNEFSMIKMIQYSFLCENAVGETRSGG
jgi:hypothetical protein